MKYETLLVNFLGGPGSGKSTLAASVFAELKWLDVNSEIATEYAKEKVWEENFKILEDQFFVFGQQIHRIHRLLGKVEVIITDSPILLSAIYDATDNEVFKNLIIQEHSKLNNLNFFINRKKKYLKSGRMQTEEQSIEIDGRIKILLESTKSPMTCIDGVKESVPSIVEIIMDKIT